MPKITNIEAHRILDSRGLPTLEVKVTTDGGFLGVDSVPSGTSTGTHEAKLVDPEVACNNVNNVLAPSLIGMNTANQQEIDEKMIEIDGTPNKEKIGANAILGVSLACARAASISEKKPLYEHLNQLFSQITGSPVELKKPTPMMVMICGGKHSSNTLGFQEFLAMGEVEDGLKIWSYLKDKFKKDAIETSIGLEGGLSPKLESNEEALRYLTEAVEVLKNDFKSKVSLGLDIAGSNYSIDREKIMAIFKKYRLLTLEDPFGEEDWQNFSLLKKDLDQTGFEYLLIGDDLLATNPELIEKAVREKAVTGAIIKLNQIGTLTQTFQVLKIAREHKIDCVVSHRSRETMDSFIADLAVAVGAKYLKSGAPVPPERMLKYRRLAEINI